MRPATVLAALAARLNCETGASHVPALYFLTDPARTPDPEATISALPRGAAVIYRHFGAANRGVVARRLASRCRSRGLALLISADPDLARDIGAAGVHWPESWVLKGRVAPHPGLRTAAAHSLRALEAAAASGAHASLLAPIFPTQSTSGNPPLGLFNASQIVRAARIPVIALGGVTSKNARFLVGRGFSGLAAVSGLTG